MSENPEIGLNVDVDGIGTNYITAGEGPPLILIHGSGPGVTAYANWRGVIPDFRHPDGIRLGLAPLTTRFTDVHDGLDALLGLLQGS